jgi:dephospho-CoA kinase
MRGISFSNWLRLNESSGNLLKAVFMLGGTGVGKSYAFQFFEGAGFHPVQSDRFFSQYLQQANISLKNIDLKDTQAQDAWDRASNDTRQQMLGHMEGMQPFVYETTGRNMVNVFEAKKALEQAGYDVYGVAISAPLQLAMQRNISRGEQGDRSVNKGEVKQIHREVKDNLPIYKQLFGNNWFEVSNDGTNDFAGQLQQVVQKITSTPVQNKVGVQKLQGAA